MSADCLFCRIVRKEIPAKLVAETDDCIAFRDINPQAPVHILIIPRQHITSQATATEGGVLGGVAMLAAEIARAEGISDSGYRTVMNTGENGGQSVAHLHMHLLGGRRLGWPPG